MLMIGAWLLSYAWPALIVANWTVQRERITQELCVQRGLPKEMNHCNGQCHLADLLRAAKEDARQQAPAPRVETVASVVLPVEGLELRTPVSEQRSFPELVEFGAEGHPPCMEPVPWC